MEVERAKCLLNEALEADEQGNAADALNLYSQAIEVLLKVVSAFRIQNSSA